MFFAFIAYIIREKSKYLNRHMCKGSFYSKKFTYFQEANNFQEYLLKHCKITALDKSKRTEQRIQL